MKIFCFCFFWFFVCVVVFIVCVVIFVVFEKDVYFFVFFCVNGEDGFYFVWSFDGYKFEMFGGDCSYLCLIVGEQKIMCDLCFFCGFDGIFYFVWMIGWEGKIFGYVFLKDFFVWFEQKVVLVMVYEFEV